MAVTLAVPEVVAVNVEVHVAVAVVPDKEHDVKVPVTPVWARATVPVGVVAPVVEVSVTETVQVEAWFATTGVLQVTVVVVTASPTVTGNAVLWLVAWVESPL